MYRLAELALPARFDREWILQEAHRGCGFSRFGRTPRALVENILRNASFKKFHAQDNHHDVVHLTDDRDEIRDELDRTEDVEDRATGDGFSIPRYLRVHKRPSDDPKLREKLLD